MRRVGDAISPRARVPGYADALRVLAAICIERHDLEAGIRPAGDADQEACWLHGCAERAKLFVVSIDLVAIQREQGAAWPFNSRLSDCQFAGNQARVTADWQRRDFVEERAVRLVGQLLSDAVAVDVGTEHGFPGAVLRAAVAVWRGLLRLRSWLLRLSCGLLRLCCGWLCWLECERRTGKRFTLITHCNQNSITRRNRLTRMSLAWQTEACAPAALCITQRISEWHVRGLRQAKIHYDVRIGGKSPARHRNRGARTTGLWIERDHRLALRCSCSRWCNCRSR